MENQNEKYPIKQRKRKKKKKLRKPIKILLFILPLILIGSVFAKSEWFDKHDYQPSKVNEKSNKNADSNQNPQAPAKKEPTEEEVIRNYISRLTLNERIGQTIIIDLTVLNNGTPGQVLNDIQIKNMKDYNIGGITFFASNIANETQVKTYVADLQKNSKLPLFISVDEEGGIVSRIASKGNFKVPVLPNMQSIGATGDASKANVIGNQLGSSLKELGFNLNFAPVSDVNTNPKNPVIGVRAFSNNPQVVASMVSEEVKGMQKHISATLKHFPGHGDTATDTHSGLSTSNATYERLKQVELVPFRAGIAAGVDFVMMSHINMTNISNDKMPSSMSSIVIKDILRRDLAFSKLIITDSLQMGAITQNYTPYQTGINCLRAGVDILLMPKNLPDTVAGIKDAIASGSYTEKELNDVVYRILKMKVDRQLLTLDQLK